MKQAASLHGVPRSDTVRRDAARVRGSGEVNRVQIVEIVIEGLRGFEERARVAFAEGVQRLEPAEKADTVHAAVLDLLYPEGHESGLHTLVLPEAAQARVGVTVVGRDGLQYRVLRDVRGGRVSLLAPGEDGALAPLTSQPAEIAQMVTARLGFPQRDVFEGVFWSAKADLPSQRKVMVTKKAAVVDDRPLPPGYADHTPAVHASDDERRTALKNAMEQWASLQRVDELEFKLDGLQKQLFTLDEQQRPLDAAMTSVDKAEAAYAAATAQLTPEQAAELYDAGLVFTRQQAKAETEIARLTDDIENTRRDLARYEVVAREEPAHVVKAALQEPLVVGGLAGAVICVAAGVIGGYFSPGARWLAMGDAIGLLVALVGAWRFVDDLEYGQRLRRRIERKEKDLSQTRSRAELDTEHALRLFASHGLELEDLGHVEDTLKRINAAAAALEVAKTELDALRASGAIDVSEERDALKQTIADTEESLYGLGGFMGDRHSIQAEVLALCQALGETPPASMAGAAAAAEYSQPMAPAPAAPIEEEPAPEPAPPEDLGQRLLSLGGDMLAKTAADVGMVLQGRMAQILGAMSDQRYVGIELGGRGEVSLVDGASRTALPFVSLTPGDRDMAYLAIKVAVLEAILAQQKMPVGLFRVFETTPPTKAPMMASLVQFLGARAQLVLATNNAHIASGAPQAVQL